MSNMLKKSIRILTIFFAFAVLLITRSVYAAGDYDSLDELNNCVEHIQEVYGNLIGKCGQIVQTVKEDFKKAQTGSRSDIIEARCKAEAYSLYLQYLTLNEYADKFDVVGGVSLLYEKSELGEAGEDIIALIDDIKNENINYSDQEDFRQKIRKLENELIFTDLSLTSKIIGGGVIEKPKAEPQDIFEKECYKFQGKIEEKSERFNNDWIGRTLSEFPYFQDKGYLFFTEDGEEVNDLKESEIIVGIENVPAPGIEKKIDLKEIRVTVSFGTGKETTTNGSNNTASSAGTSTGATEGLKEVITNKASFWKDNKYLIIAVAVGVICIILSLILVMNARAKRKRALKRRIDWKAAKDDFEDGIIYSKDDETVQRELKELAREEGITLRFEVNDGSKSSYHLTHKMIVGRGPDCEIVLNQAIFSREHFMLEWDGESVYIEDLETRNGTKVNGSLLRHKRRIESGDIIGVGDVEITIRWYG